MEKGFLFMGSVIRDPIQFKTQNYKEINYEMSSLASYLKAAQASFFLSRSTSALPESFTKHTEIHTTSHVQVRKQGQSEKFEIKDRIQ